MMDFVLAGHPFRNVNGTQGLLNVGSLQLPLVLLEDVILLFDIYLRQASPKFSE